MYGCSNRIFRFLVGFAFVMIGTASFAIYYHSGRVSPFSSRQGCHALFDSMPTLQAASGWEILLVYDLVLFGMTLYKARATAHDDMNFVGALGGRISLMQVLISDGSLYFVVVALSNMPNILSFYLTEASFRGGLSTVAVCISVTMMSRLMLNLRAADRGTDWDSFSGHSLRFARPPASRSDPNMA
ncbi:hypothetical protein K435DRAFT_495748 [Dendrothele bispora CBS 962.96]|uniref:Uncharacterized protein n=1 Tax=Dendrothele bispora (strain CBS 962.96) TaxID=1314807 RepID=A0A4V4HBS8_DENBC|nr:hypothetical protein K435DRAFT_495748 [Dendrothele bispora CBS 962.96]